MPTKGGSKKKAATSSRFHGRSGQETIIRCLSESRLLSGNKIACQELAKAGELIKHGDGKPIIEQGADDDWIYFLISGAVKVFVNNRHIATREACTHLGEMSVIDPQARRSATVISEGDSISLRVPADQFIRITNEFPEIWRRIASELASRIRQRNAFHRAPNPLPKIFIGSSSEANFKAKQVSDALKAMNFDVRLWSEDVFSPSDTTVEGLERAAEECDFAVLLVTPDDVTTSRKKSSASPRDNVIYELGLFSGVMSRRRAFILMERSISTKLPSDLQGVTRIPYEAKKKITTSSLNDVCASLARAITKLGPR
jgi:predicted nucleotide-binding protein